MCQFQPPFSLHGAYAAATTAIIPKSTLHCVGEDEMKLLEKEFHSFSL